MTTQVLGGVGPAVEHLKTGGTATRLTWLGDFLVLRPGDVEDTHTLPYIVITSAAGDRQPWTPTHEDLLADDWIAL